MKTLSIRVRIALWYAAVFAPFLGVLAVGAYFFIAYTSQERVDEFLAESAATIASAIEFERKQGAADTVAVSTVVAAMSLPDVAVHVRDGRSGREVTSVDGLRFRRTARPALERELASRLAGTARSAATKPEVVTVRAEREDVRVLTLPYTLGARPLLIAVAQVMTARSLMLRDARLMLGLGLPFVILVATVGGWWLAGKSLSPVDAMSRQAHAIGAANLHERLPVKNAGDELGRLAGVFNELLERLERAFEAQARFAADASHELRTPVAVISGEAELALTREDRPREELAEALRVVRDESVRMRRIVDDLFFLARADAGEPMMRRSPLYLRDLAEDSVRAVRSLALAREITLRLVGDVDAPVKGDEQLLRRAIDNLVVNAIKYSRPSGEIVVQLAEEGDQCTVTVRDSGEGIAAEDQARLFERFYRTDLARASKTDGSGLGLAIVRWVARAHGGEAELVESSPSGSAFRLIVPRGEVSAPRA